MDFKNQDDVNIDKDKNIDEDALIKEESKDLKEEKDNKIDNNEKNNIKVNKSEPNIMITDDIESDESDKQISVKSKNIHNDCEKETEDSKSDTEIEKFPAINNEEENNEKEITVDNESNVGISNEEIENTEKKDEDNNNIKIEINSSIEVISGDNLEEEKVKEDTFIDVYIDEENIKNDVVKEDDFLLKAASFYSENYKYSKDDYNLGKKKLLIYSLISSIFGGLVVAILFSIYYSKTGINLNLFGKDDYSGLSNNLISNKIEIEKTDAPVIWIAKKISPGIVGIEVNFSSSDIFFNSEKSSSTGSGIIIRSDGYIVTNYHVIENVNDSESIEILVTLPSNLEKKYEAKVVGTDSKTDIAVLHIEATGLYEAQIGESDQLEVGDLAVAIGNPGSLEYMGSVTVGVISGLNREIAVADNTTLKLIQTDAAINPGNSGGALVNSTGEIVAMNTAKLSGVDFEGLGFAIPIEEVQEISNSLIEYKYVKGRPLVGVVINEDYTEAYAQENNYPVGLLVDDVVPLSGAYNAGIKVGDLITKIDEVEVSTFSEFEKIKNEHSPGDDIELEIYREDEILTVNVRTTEEKSN
jgi:serine protease Do